MRGGVKAAAANYLNKGSTENIDITGKNDIGIYNNSGAQIDFTGETIKIANTAPDNTEWANNAAVWADASAKSSVINLGGDATKEISIAINETKESTNGTEIGLWAKGNNDQKGGIINVNGDTLRITGTSGFDYVYGILAQNVNMTDAEKNTAADGEATVNINTENTYIDVDSKIEDGASGLVAMSNGNINVNSNLEVHADSAIVARGNAVVNINTDGKHSTKIYGDVNFNYDQATSGTAIDATVNMNLTGADSVWEGNIMSSWSSDSEHGPDAGEMDVTGLHLTLADGAQWNVTTVKDIVSGSGSEYEGTAYQSANNVTLNGGIINITGAKKQETDNGTIHTGVTIENLSGTGGTVNLEADDKFNTRELNIQKANGNGENAPTRLAVNFTGINADDISNNTEEQQKQLETLAGNVKFGTGDAGIAGDNLNATATVGEGLINGGISAVMNTAATGGIGSIQDGTIQQNNTTTTMDNMRDLAAVSIAAWRQEDSTLSQRLGDLRESKEGQGIWARMNRGEFEYSGAFKNQYNYFQIGYDMAKGDWHYGAAVSHTDGETSYASGYGENDSTSLSLYGTRLMNDGQYLDLVLKVGRLSNEFDNYAETAGHTHGDYDAWGTAISGEYGKKLDLKEGWFVTPQAQLSLMRIGGEDYTTSSKIAVSQDTLYSAVGRIGFEAGKDTGWGSLYAKASVLHEFAGDADTYVRLGNLSNSYSQDLGDTWYEAGFGFNWKMGNGSYFYADVIRTFGGDIETPWQWNAGVRWGF